MPQRFRVHEGSAAYFVTNTVLHWIPVFCRQDYFRVLVDSLNYCAESKNLAIHGYVLMPNHFHLLTSQKEGKLSQVMRDLKRHTSKLLAAKLEEDGRNVWLNAFRKAGETRDDTRVWMSEFHPVQVYSRPVFEQKIEYMHANPVRAGYIHDPCDWTYSSAGFYYKGESSEVCITPIEW